MQSSKVDDLPQGPSRKAISWAIGLCLMVLTPVVEAQSNTDAQAPVPRLTPRLRPRPPAPSTAATPKSAPTRPPPTARPPQSTVPQPYPKASPRQTSPPIDLPPAGGFYPPILPVYPGLAPPQGYVEKKSFNHSLLWSGGVVFVASYGVGLAYAGANGFDGGLGSLAVPLLGPWLALGKRKFDCEVKPITGIPDGDAIDESVSAAQACWGEQVKVAAILTGLGVGQLVGGMLVAAGLIDQKKTWLRADLDQVSLRFDVQTGPGMSGLIASGSF